MTTQSVSYSTIQSFQPTTVKGYDVDGIDANGRPVRVRRNRFGGVVPVRGATLLTAYGKGVVTGYTSEGNLRVAITDFNDDYAFELADGSDIYTAEEKVAMLSRCANAGIDSLIETITRLYKSEITDKLSKTWQEKVDAIERFASNEFVMDLTDKSYVPADTECIVKVISLDRETKAERKRRIAKERKAAKALADRLLAEYGADDMPDDVADEIADEFAELDGEF
jgi:hypothetical protein